MILGGLYFPITNSTYIPPCPVTSIRPYFPESNQHPTSTLKHPAYLCRQREKNFELLSAAQCAFKAWAWVSAYWSAQFMHVHWWWSSPAGYHSFQSGSYSQARGCYGTYAPFNLRRWTWNPSRYIPVSLFLEPAPRTFLFRRLNHMAHGLRHNLWFPSIFHVRLGYSAYILFANDLLCFSRPSTPLI